MSNKVRDLLFSVACRGVVKLCKDTKTGKKGGQVVKE